MTVEKSLKSLSAYPLSSAVIENIAEEAGLALGTEATQETRSGRCYKLAMARVYIFLAEAPNVTQGGIQYYFSDEERDRLMQKGKAILDTLGEGDSESLPTFGYQGENL